MSEIRDRFFELLSPTIEAEDFEFKKSKGCFVKTIGDLHHEISFRWDGRGGLVHLESIDLKINSISIEKAVKKLTFNGGLPQCWVSYNPFGLPQQFPNMYGQAALLLFSDVNLKGLSKLTFEEKYPLEKIENGVKCIVDIFQNRLSVTLNEFKTHQDIYNHLLLTTSKVEKAAEFPCNYAILVKLFAKKLGIEEPKILQGSLAYIEEFKGYLAHQGKIDFDNLDNNVKNYPI